MEEESADWLIEHIAKIYMDQRGRVGEDPLVVCNLCQRWDKQESERDWQLVDW